MTPLGDHSFWRPEIFEDLRPVPGASFGLLVIERKIVVSAFADERMTSYKLLPGRFSAQVSCHCVMRQGVKPSRWNCHCERGRRRRRSLYSTGITRYSTVSAVRQLRTIPTVSSHHGCDIMVFGCSRYC